MYLSGGIGQGESNRPDDVRLVQRLLNLAPDGPSPSLQVDGLFGGKTLAAIRAFEVGALGRREPTGTIRPNDAVLDALASHVPPGLSALSLSLLAPRGRDRVIEAVWPHLEALMPEYGIDTPLRQAHFLAQIAHESDGLRVTEEYASGADYEGRTDLGNTEPGDGRRFKGRGLIQLTGRANYTEFSRHIGVDLTRDGAWARVAAEPELAVRCACWFWQRNGLNSLADRDDLYAVTRRINGGLNGIGDRAAHLGRARSLLRLDPPSPALAAPRRARQMAMHSPYPGAAG